MGRLVDRLLRHYAERSGAKAKHFRAHSRAAVAACLADMDGTDAAKEMRMQGVIEDAIAASHARGIPHPPIAFVFNVTHVRRRLERLAEADHLARKAEAETSVDVLAAVRVANEAPTPEHLGATLLASSRQPLAKTGHGTRKTLQDAPAGKTPPRGTPSILTSPGGVYGPEEALRVLIALGGEGDEGPAGDRSPSPLDVPLSAEERAELEAAQLAARARWARAG